VVVLVLASCALWALGNDAAQQSEAQTCLVYNYEQASPRLRDLWTQTFKQSSFEISKQFLAQQQLAREDPAEDKDRRPSGGLDSLVRSRAAALRSRPWIPIGHASTRLLDIFNNAWKQQVVELWGSSKFSVHTAEIPHLQHASELNDAFASFTVSRAGCQHVSVPGLSWLLGSSSSVSCVVQVPVHGYFAPFTRTHLSLQYERSSAIGILTSTLDWLNSLLGGQYGVGGSVADRPSMASSANVLSVPNDMETKVVAGGTLPQDPNQPLTEFAFVNSESLSQNPAARVTVRTVTDFATIMKLLLGIFIMFMAPLVARSRTLHLATGTVLGSVAFLLIIVFIFAKIVPGKRSIVALSVFGVMSSVLAFMGRTLYHFFLENLLALLICSALGGIIGFSIAYKYKIDASGQRLLEGWISMIAAFLVLNGSNNFFVSCIILILLSFRRRWLDLLGCPADEDNMMTTKEQAVPNSSVPSTPRRPDGSTLNVDVEEPFDVEKLLQSAEDEHPVTVEEVIEDLVDASGRTVRRTVRKSMYRSTTPSRMSIAPRDRIDVVRASEVSSIVKERSRLTPILSMIAWPASMIWWLISAIMRCICRSDRLASPGAQSAAQSMESTANSSEEVSGYDEDGYALRANDPSGFIDSATAKAFASAAYVEPSPTVTTPVRFISPEQYREETIHETAEGLRELRDVVRKRGAEILPKLSHQALVAMREHLEHHQEEDELVSRRRSLSRRSNSRSRTSVSRPTSQQSPSSSQRELDDFFMSEPEPSPQTSRTSGLTSTNRQAWANAASPKLPTRRSVKRQ